MNQDLQTVALLRKDLSENERTQFDTQFRPKSPNVAFILSFFLGTLGGDRFYLGNIGRGVGKVLTIGGLGVWWLIDLFLIRGSTRQLNMKHAQEIHSTIKSVRS